MLKIQFCFLGRDVLFLSFFFLLGFYSYFLKWQSRWELAYSYIKLHLCQHQVKEFFKALEAPWNQAYLRRQLLLTSQKWLHYTFLPETRQIGSLQGLENTNLSLSFAPRWHNDSLSLLVLVRNRPHPMTPSESTLGMSFTSSPACPK